MMFVSCKTSSQQLVQHSLKFDGLYFTEKIESDHAESYRYYLRFYENGKVIGSSSTGEPKEVKEWLITSSDNLSVGEYVITGNEIAFDLTTKSGTVSYKGTIAANQLTLLSESQINGFKSTKQYKFKSMNFTN